ncbi:MAG: hypothetical protein EXR09_00280 [Acetobacteraceae bacterium]|nr:hypothetical protein [Acetobacteraceae bacterium]
MARAGIAAERAPADFARAKSAKESAAPTMRYAEILTHVHAALAQEWGVPSTAVENTAFDGSIPD